MASALAMNRVNAISQPQAWRHTSASRRASPVQCMRQEESRSTAAAIGSGIATSAASLAILVSGANAVPLQVLQPTEYTQQQASQSTFAVPQAEFPLAAIGLKQAVEAPADDADALLREGAKDVKDATKATTPQGGAIGSASSLKNKAQDKVQQGTSSAAASVKKNLFGFKLPFGAIGLKQSVEAPADNEDALLKSATADVIDSTKATSPEPTTEAGKANGFKARAQEKVQEGTSDAVANLKDNVRSAVKKLPLGAIGLKESVEAPADDEVALLKEGAKDVKDATKASTPEKVPRSVADSKAKRGDVLASSKPAPYGLVRGSVKETAQLRVFDKSADSIGKMRANIKSAYTQAGY